MNLEKFITEFKQNNVLAADIVAQIHALGGIAVVVGGAVRDWLLGALSKDLDIEVYGLEPAELENVLRKYGFLQQVGKNFGVYLLLGVNIDWSLPRSDSAGRKPRVNINPNLDFVSAFRRRDLTINAMGINLRTGELIDPFGGKQDLQNKILRYVDRDRFVEDPLRFYRVMQFVGRFEMLPDQELNELCSEMEIDSVSKERVQQEFAKLFLKSKNPALALKWLQKIGKLQQVLPELYDTIGIPQNPVWHPEGDVFEHTCQSLDAAAREVYENDSEKLIIMWAVICHDLGKAKTTKLVEGIWRSFGHAAAGVNLAKALLMRFFNSDGFIKTVTKLVRYHMEPGQFIRNQVGLVAYKKLAFDLYPQTLQLLTKLALADRAGRLAATQNSLPAQLDLSYDLDLEVFVSQAKMADVWSGIEAPILQGRDLLDFVKPGHYLGKLLKKAYLIQLEEGIVDKNILKKRILDKF